MEHPDSDRLVNLMAPIIGPTAFDDGCGSTLLNDRRKAVAREKAREIVASISPARWSPLDSRCVGRDIGAIIGAGDRDG